MKTYKVWTVIEEIDESIDYYEDIGEPVSVMEFNTLEMAEKFQKTLFWEWGKREEDPADRDDKHYHEEQDHIAMVKHIFPKENTK